MLFQTAAICHFLGCRHELAPRDEAGQALEGLAHAFPRGFARASEATPGVLALRDRYPELDAD